MATQVTTQATLSAEAKTFYDRSLLEAAKPQLVFAQFGQQRPLMRGHGKTIEFRRFSLLNPATTPITEGVVPAGNSLNVTAITAAINQYGDYISGSDLLDLTSIDPILTETSMVLGQQAGATVDRVVRDSIMGGTNVQYANGRASRLTVAAGDVLTVNEVRRAVRTMKRNKARPLGGGDYVAILSPGGSYDLQSDPAWVNAAQYSGSAPIFSGEIGRLYGVRFVETTETTVYTAGGAAGIDVHATLVLGENAYGYIPLEGGDLEFVYKPLGSSGTSDPLNQVWSSAWKVSFTARILNDSFLIRIEHGVSA